MLLTTLLALSGWGTWKELLPAARPAGWILALVVLATLFVLPRSKGAAVL